MEIKTPSDLKYCVERSGFESYFFTRKTMNFFGDTMRNYGVRKMTIDTTYDKGLSVYELYRRKPVKHNLIESAYFDAKTFKRVHKKI